MQWVIKDLEEHVSQSTNIRKGHLSGVQNAKTEDDLGSEIADKYHADDISEIKMNISSVPSKYEEMFEKTLQDFVDYDKSNGELNNARRVLALSGVLLGSHTKFFDDVGEKYANREKFIADAAELTKVHDFVDANYSLVLQKYANLVDVVDNKKLDFYVKTLMRIRNHNFIEPLAEGLVGVLVNMEYSDARTFIGETFKLLRQSNGTTHGLSDATDYITRRTDFAKERYQQLVN